MTSLTQRFLLGTLVAGLLACQAPNASETASTENNETSSGTSASVDVGLDVGTSGSGDSSSASAGSSTSANANMTLEMRGKTYTYGQIKSYYQCVVESSPNTSIKGSASAALTRMNDADQTADEKDDREAYTSAATGIQLLQGYAKADCTP